MGNNRLHRRVTWAKRLFLLTSIGGFIWFFAANYTIESNAEGKLFNNVETCPAVKVAIVLGASKSLANRNSNPYFAYRIEAAITLYKAGKVKYFIVSGDNHVKGYDEPTDMKNALMAGGVPDSAIFLDYAGFRTLDSMERAIKVFGQQEVMVISQQFHNERAIYLGEHFGMKVIGFNAKDVGGSGIRTKLRERFARMKVFWDLLWGVDSRFLGPKVQIPA